MAGTQLQFCVLVSDEGLSDASRGRFGAGSCGEADDSVSEQKLPVLLAGLPDCDAGEFRLGRGDEPDLVGVVSDCGDDDSVVFDRR